MCIRGGSKAINDMEKEDNCSPVEQEMVAISTYLSSMGSIRTLFSLQQILSFWLQFVFLSESPVRPRMLSRTLIRIEEVNSDPPKKFWQASYDAGHCG